MRGETDSISSIDLETTDSEGLNTKAHLQELFHEGESRIRSQGKLADLPPSAVWGWGTWGDSFWLLAFWVVATVLFGTGDRVSFKILSYAMHNYLYANFLVAVILNTMGFFVVTLFKLVFTNHITKAMQLFPKWKFAVIGILQALSFLMLNIWGSGLSGILQLLLLQVILPFSMLFSLLLLRYQGNHVCRTARAILDKNGVNYTEIYLGDEVIAKSREELCRLIINGRDVGNIPSRLRCANPPDADVLVQLNKRLKGYVEALINRIRGTEPAAARSTLLFGPAKGSGRVIIGRNDLFRIESLGSADAAALLLGDVDISELQGEVLLLTDRHSWKRHLATYYTVPQYIGVIVILTGVFISLVNKLHPEKISISHAIAYALSTLPGAFSLVYLELNFRELDLDPWYVNALIALPQLVVSVISLLIVAYVTPGGLWANMVNGLLCLYGDSTITRADGYRCQYTPCDDNTLCCDVCNGEIPGNGAGAGYMMLIYTVISLFYNVGQVNLIKYFSASFMYAAATLALPLGSLLFSAPFMGVHRQKYELLFTPIGLAIVVGGLIIYYGLDVWWRKKRLQTDRERQSIDPYCDASGYRYNAY